MTHSSSHLEQWFLPRIVDLYRSTNTYTMATLVTDYLLSRIHPDGVNERSGTYFGLRVAEASDATPHLTDHPIDHGWHRNKPGPTKCGSCAKNLGRSSSVWCHRWGCGWVHLKCSGLPDTSQHNRDFVCPKCRESCIVADTQQEEAQSVPGSDPSEPIPTTIEEPPPTDTQTGMLRHARHPLSLRKIAQINCNGLMARMTELKNWIHRHKPLAILLQKTLLKEGQSVTPPSGYCESGRKESKPYPPVNPQQRKTYVKPSGGVLTWIRLDTSYTHLPIQSAKEWVDICAIILRDREETALVNIYWTPNNSRANPEDPSFLRDLPIGRNTVIAGDFNDHSSWDSCQSENQRGREVEDWILGSNLHCVNDCDTHTRTNPATGGHSSPDFTICSGDIAEDIRTSWKTGEDVGSDHLPIIWDLPHKRARQARPQPKWCYKKADWNAFRDALSTMKPEGRNLEEENSNFLKSLLRAAKLASRKGHGKAVTSHSGATPARKQKQKE